MEGASSLCAMGPVRDEQPAARTTYYLKNKKSQIEYYSLEIIMNIRQCSLDVKM